MGRISKRARMLGAEAPDIVRLVLLPGLRRATRVSPSLRRVSCVLPVLHRRADRAGAPL